MSILLQFDNRTDIDFIKKNQEINQLACKEANIDYQFLDLNTKYTYQQNVVGSTIEKLFIISDFIQKSSHDILIFLDSDAWIQNPSALLDLIQKLKFYSDYKEVNKEKINSLLLSNIADVTL